MTEMTRESRGLIFFLRAFFSASRTPPEDFAGSCFFWVWGFRGLGFRGLGFRMVLIGCSRFARRSVKGRGLGVCSEIAPGLRNPGPKPLESRGLDN